MTTGTTSLRRLARLIGVSEKAVRKAETSGVFKGSVRRGDDGVPVVVDVALAVTEWERSGRQLRGVARQRQVPPTTAAPSASVPASAPAAAAASELPALEELGDERDELPGADPGAAAPPAPPSLVEAQIDAMRERARKLRMENDLREGSLVEVDQASRQAFEFARTLRENVLNLPARISAELAAESDAARVYSLLDAALRGALEATAGMLETVTPTEERSAS